MRIAPSAPVSARSAVAPSAPTAPTAPAGNEAWTNPAASAALHTTSDLLQGIEDGMVRNFRNPEAVRAYVIDLRSTLDIIDAATTAITGDASKENDAFLPLMSTVGDGVAYAENRLAAQNFAVTWPVERGDILAAIRRARAISRNVADQLDPRTTPAR